MKTITVKIPLSFDSDLMSVNEIDFEQIKSKLPEGQTIHKDPLLFKQDGGLQEIVVCYKEGDEYGKKILERIINSVELKNDKE
jgi:hypothetical protein